MNNRLEEVLRIEKRNNLSGKSKRFVLFAVLTRHPAYMRFKYIKAMRKANYYRDLASKKVIYTIPYLVNERIKNVRSKVILPSLGKDFFTQVGKQFFA